MERDPLAPASFRVEAYLDEILAPLARSLSPFHRDEIRRELRAHLWARVDAYRELGQPEEEAVTEALQQFGGAEDFLRQWQREWMKTTPQGTLREVWQATRFALLLSFPTLLIACLSAPVWSQQIKESQYSWAPEWMRYCWIAYITPGWGGFALDFVLLPLALGVAVGRFIPQYAGIGMLIALAIEVTATSWFSLSGASGKCGILSAWLSVPEH